MILISQGLGVIGESVPPLFDPLGEGADEKEVNVLVASVPMNAAAGRKKTMGGGGKVRESVLCIILLQ